MKRLLSQRVCAGPLALAVLGLAACATAPTDPAALQAPVAPAHWAAPWAAQPAAPAPGAQWWQAFGDAGLTQLVEQALQANPDVAAALAAVAQARAVRDGAQATTGPTLDASAAVQRSQTGNASPGAVWRAGLDASWEIDAFGRRAAGVQASEADVRASEAQLRGVRLTLAAEVATTYFEWWGARERLRLAQESLAAQRAALQLTAWRAQAGLASALDLETARAAVEQTAATVPALEAAARQAMHALAVLTGRPPAAPLPTPPAAAPQPPAAWVLPLPADALRQRPDVAAAEARLQAAYARVRQAEAAQWPTLRLGGALSLAAPRVSDLFDVAALTRSLAASLAASLFDGGAAEAQVRAQAAAAEQARAALASALLAALRDVENALVALAADRARLDRLQAAVASATQAERLASQRYAAGLIDYRALLDAQRTLLAVQSDLAAVRTAWATDHVRLIKALGGRPDADAATPPAVPTAQP